MLAQNIRSSAKKKTLIKHLPLGTVYCMLPSRYPLLMSFYKCLPQLLMGNGVMVRHAHTNLGISREVEKIMRKGGFESGDYQAVWNDHKHTEMIIGNQQITGVSFTGSTARASVIGAIAGKYLKRAHIAGTMRSVLVVL
jgi:succinate-semialdehyde dehydrogenase / glutarate-semialdehyde dehydrogenase